MKQLICDFTGVLFTLEMFLSLLHVPDFHHLPARCGVSLAVVGKKGQAIREVKLFINGLGLLFADNDIEKQRNGENVE